MLVKVYSETCRPLTKYIRSHGGKGYYCYYAGALEEDIRISVSPNN